ncbi:MAG: hypothetical protein CM1200mP9_00840 [Gammaproteobacteria bacterium]|nr:MAG: hypothetical protein CM1200mP9_00840 [Gammaproteobacteria bacterium]
MRGAVEIDRGVLWKCRVLSAVGSLCFWDHWIGLLFYFNLIQGGYMAAASNEAKVDAFTKFGPQKRFGISVGARCLRF